MAVGETRIPYKLVVGLAFCLLGAVAIVVAWVGVRDLLDVAAQVPYLISGGMGGLGLIVAGVWLLRSYETDLLREVLARLAERLERVEGNVAEVRGFFDGAVLEDLEAGRRVGRR